MSDTTPRRDNTERNTGDLGNDQASSADAPPATEGGHAAAPHDSSHDEDDTREHSPNTDADDRE